MNRLIRICGLALALAALAGSAAAQTAARTPRVMTAIPQTSSASAANRAAAQSTGPAASKQSEPAAMGGMLAAQNLIRSKLNLSQLSWSMELATEATETATAASARACGKSSALRVGEAAGAAVYWAAPLRMFSGGGSAQEISPPFLISEWQAGAGDYDAATGQCRSGGACKSYARLADPAVKAVGCARNLCESQAQVWVCHYGR
jgi:Cysteine-rich secretory protein family